MTEKTAKPFTSADEIVQRLRQDDSIPALDENVQALNRMTLGKNTSAADLTAVIMRDAALTSRLIAIANSAGYRPRNPVRTISSAVVLFGFERIHQLAMGLSIFNKHSGDTQQKDLYRLLVCAYSTANLAMYLAHAAKDETPEELFVTGLMQQIPRLVLAHGFPELYHDMELRINEKKVNIENACEEVFGVRFSDISNAISTYWNLTDTTDTHLSADVREKRNSAIQLAITVSDLIFGNTPSSKQIVGAATDSIREFLKKPNLSLPEFVGSAAEGDPNMAEFFNLSTEDMVMMTRIAEWGKVSSSDVANSLTSSLQKAPPKPNPVDVQLQMAHFLSELMLAIRDRYAFNDILMIAQEGIFRCIPSECVVAAFIDRTRQHLQGRLYAGRRPGISASRCRVLIESGTCMAAKNLAGRDATIYSLKNQQHVYGDDVVLRELGVASVILVPILANSRPIGQFMIGRSIKDPPFNADDCLWMSAIAGHVGLSFEQIS